MKHLFFVLLLLVVIQPLFSQPYYYKTITYNYEEFPTHPFFSNLCRMNFATGTVDTVLKDLRVMSVTDELSKNRFIVKYYHGEDAIWDMAKDTSYNLDTTLGNLRGYTRATVGIRYALDDRQKNLLCIVTEVSEPEYHTKIFFLNNTTYALYDTVILPKIVDGDRKSLLSFSQNKSELFYYMPDTTGIYFRVIDAATHKEKNKRRCGTISYLGRLGRQWLEDGKNGFAVISYQLTYGNILTTYTVFCDVNNGTTSSPLQYPWPSKGKISFDGTKMLLLKETSSSSTQQIDIFDSKTNVLLQSVQVPAGGEIFMFEDYPDVAYYYICETDNGRKDYLKPKQIIKIPLNTVTSVPELFDWFSSTVLAQSIANKEVVNSAFINQLQTHINNAKTYYLQNDIANAKKELTKFRERLGNTPQRKEGNPFVKKEGYKNLFFNAGYLMGRL